MIEPYKMVFTEVVPLLERLHFSKESESQFGAVYSRSNGYRLIISIEQSGDAFSSELEKQGSGLTGHLSPECLMEAIAPEKAVAASQAIRKNGFNQKGISIWWNTFLTFLLDNQDVIFSFPSAGSHWESYVRVYNQKVREMGISSCSEIG